MQSPLKGILVGAGYFGQFQAEAWQRIAGAAITAVVDADLAKAQALAAQFQIARGYVSLADAIAAERPDFIDIATRPDSHLNLTRLAAQQRVHVICQKPMAPTWDDCVAMVEACEAAGVRLLIHENWRWQPWYREIKQLLAEGTVGQMFQLSAQWRTGDGRGPKPYANQPYFREMPRLLVYESLVHLLDTFRFLGGDLASVFCRNRQINHMIAGEDASLILVQFRSGVAGLIDANRITGPDPAPVAMNILTIEGDQGTLQMSADGRIWTARHGREAVEHAFNRPTAGYKGDSVRALQEHLLTCLLTGQPSESEGREYLKTAAAVFACYESARLAQPVKLPPVP